MARMYPARNAEVESWWRQYRATPLRMRGADAYVQVRPDDSADVQLTSEMTDIMDPALPSTAVWHVAGVQDSRKHRHAALRRAVLIAEGIGGRTTFTLAVAATFVFETLCPGSVAWIGRGVRWWTPRRENTAPRWEFVKGPTFQMATVGGEELHWLEVRGALHEWEVEHQRDRHRLSITRGTGAPDLIDTLTRKVVEGLAQPPEETPSDRTPGSPRDEFGRKIMAA